MRLAVAEVYKNEGIEEYSKDNFHSAINFYTEGIKVNCKDKELNSQLYNNRAAAHFNLGEKLLLYIYFVGYVMLFFLKSISLFRVSGSSDVITI